MRVSDSHIRVRYAETDAQGVVYYANYLVWFEVGRGDYMRKMGMPYGELERRGQGVMIVEASCRYHIPARFDEELVIKTWCDEVKRTSFRFRYEVRRAADDLLLATGHTVQVFMDMAAGRPTAIPSDVRRLLMPAAE